MKRIFTLLFLVISGYTFSQTVNNNGGLITAQPGSFIYVNGSVMNNNFGIVAVNGDGTPTSAEMYVTQNITNNADIQANGYIRLLGNWFDNANFTSATGTVFFEGGNQFLGGTSATQFFNVTLDGTGIKTQQVTKFANGTLDLKSLHLNTDVNGFFVTNAQTNSVQRTTGFVSSANGGFLSRATNSTETYLYPVGSTANSSFNIPGSGTFRYRPVEVMPINNLANEYSVRLANVDATNETPAGYDRSLADPIICSSNPFFYHQIDRVTGGSSASINVYFDPISDGNWSDAARWNISTPMWQDISTPTIVNGAPLTHVNISNWSDFNDIPYVLTNTGILSPLITTPQSGGCSPIIVSLTTPAVQGQIFTWFANGTALGNGSTLNTQFTAEGCYDIALTASNGNCNVSSSALALICVDPTPVAAFNAAPTSFEYSEGTILFDNLSENATAYSWIFGDVSTSTQVNPAVFFEGIDENMLVTLIASSNNGCTDTAVLVLPYANLPVYYIPNTFTPDDNEHNQTWKPVFTSGFDPYHFSLHIFNRWGEVIWESNDASVGWDGTYGSAGLKCQDGVYSFELRFKAPQNDNRYKVNGHITLIR
jgi:gliding motility-associated-like protein